MRTLTVLDNAMLWVGMMILVSTGTGVAQTEGENGEEVVMGLHRQLIEAYSNGDTETFRSLLDPSAELLIFHPRGYFQFESFPQVSKGMEHMLKRLGASTWVERDVRVVIREEVGWVTSLIAIAELLVDRGIASSRGG